MNATLKGGLWILTAGALGIGAAMAVPWMAQSLPWSAELALAEGMGGEPEGTRCRPDGRRDAALKQLVGRLFPLETDDPHIPLRVDIISGKAANAFATLGARVFVFEGLIQQAESPEEVAGMLAHEIEHVRLRHVLQGTFVDALTRGTLGILLDSNGGGVMVDHFLRLQFSKSQEAQADTGAIKRLHNARIDTHGWRDFFMRAHRQGDVPSFLSGHPANAARAALARQTLSVPSEEATLPALTEEAWHGLRQPCE